MLDFKKNVLLDSIHIKGRNSEQTFPGIMKKGLNGKFLAAFRLEGIMIARDHF
jgi:hypothetical protein